MKKNKFICFRVVCFVLAILLIIYIPRFSGFANDNLERIYGTFVGEKSDYNGFIEIWNIDTFEGGAKSKFSILTRVAENFQKKHKTVYIMVRNITERECENMLSQGQVPDLFSCSYGTAEKIKPYLMPIAENNFELSSNFLKSGMLDNKLFGAAWCSGLYFMISTNNNLKNAGVDVSNDFSLAKNAFSLGYKTKGKKPKNVYSVSFASKDYLMSKNAILSYNENEAIISELSFDSSKNSSQYESYIDFLLNKSVMCIGSQRDVLRINNRENLGKISDVIVQPVLTTCDLVQFMFLTKSEDEIKNKYKQLFVEFLLDESVQSELLKMSLFPTISNFEFELNFGKNNIISNIDLERLQLKNVFIPISEIKKLQ